MNAVQVRTAPRIGEAAAPKPSSSVEFYDAVPSFELSLDEFEEFALKRLKVLRKIEELKVRNVSGDAYRSQLSATVKANLTSVKIDSASHFILRAAYCRTEDLRRWFLTQEGHLFKHRIENIPEAAMQAVLNKINLQRVSNADKNQFREQLMSFPNVTPGEFASTPYYSIPFTQALDLVAKRGCFVHAGQAYVPLPKVVSILSAKFRMALSRSLVLASSAFSHVEEEARIAPLLKTMNSHYTGKERYTGDQAMVGDNELTSQNIDSMASNMPLCMSQLHVGLKRDAKLKHWGRLQYGLFLKGAGMTLEESTLFFLREFSKSMTTEQFHKNYSYNIRHMYGKEGKRASYTPYNCKKVIMGNPPQSGDHHGCPFRHYDDSHLSSVLQKLSIGTSTDRGEIMRLKKSHNYQLACLKHFEVQHPGATTKPGVDTDNVGNHPNAWFSASVSYSSADYKPKEADVTAAKAAADVAVAVGSN